jgi:hypothetical protein
MSTRRKAVIGGGVAIVLAAVLVAGGVFVTQAAPLAVGDRWGPPVGGRDTGVGYEGSPQFQVPYAEDGEILWGVELVNPLPVPVTIRGIRPLLSDLQPLVVSEELRRTTPGTESLAPDDLSPFEPVELSPGERVFLVVREQFAACEPAHESWLPGGGVGRTTLPLDLAVLGVSRSFDVPLPFGIFYSAPPGDCPAT